MAAALGGLVGAPVQAGVGASPQVMSAGLGLVGEDRGKAIQCLAQAISYEAGHEPEAGQEAVAQLVLNRLRDPRYPKTVCGVVFQGSERRTGCQFTFTCDGALTRWKPGTSWGNAQRIAGLAVDGGLPSSPIGEALNYHADYVQPGWAARLTRVAQIGQHIFYRTGARHEGTTSALSDSPRSATLSVWGLATAVLVPVAGRVVVQQNR